MRGEFSVYLQLGFEHIADLGAYDHILFIIALCAIYRLREWRKVAILVTAFTVGHSITLALAALNVIPVNEYWIELLIPITILLTALYNVIAHKGETAKVEGTFNRRVTWNYLFALFFGLIHGMGFSNFFRSMLLPGEEDSLVRQLFAFNLGVEIGQLAIVAFILTASFIAFNLLRVRQREWNLFISGAAASLALVMALERL
jgi:hypothetical protein